MAVDDTDTELVEESLNENDDVDLEDIEVSLEDIDGVVEKPTESKDDETDDDVESEDTKESEEVAEQSDEPEEPVEAPEELSPADQQKAFNKEQAQKRIYEKQQRDAQVRDQQQQYVNETEDPLETATRQNQVELYNIKTENLSTKLTNGYERALKDFDILRDPSPAIQAEVNSAIDAFQALYVPIDAYGNPSDVKADFYTYLQTKADSISQLTGFGVKQQAQNKLKEKSKTLVTPSRAPKEPKKDSEMDAFDEEASKW